MIEKRQKCPVCLKSWLIFKNQRGWGYELKKQCPFCKRQLYQRYSVDRFDNGYCLFKDLGGI